MAAKETISIYNTRCGDNGQTCTRNHGEKKFTDYEFWSHEDLHNPFRMPAKSSNSLPLIRKINKAALQCLENEANGMDGQQTSLNYAVRQRRASDNGGICWKWEADDGRWHPFEDKEQQRIEHALQTGQKTIPMLDGLHFMHMIDLSQMEKVNMRNGTGKKIKRIPSQSLPISQKSCEESRCGNSPNMDNDYRFDTCPLSARSADITYYSQRFGNHTLNTYDPDNIDDNWDYPGSTPRFWSRHSVPVRHAGSYTSKPSKRKTVSSPTKTGSPASSCESKQSSSTLSATKLKSKEYVALRKWLKLRGLEEHFSRFKKDKVTLKELKLLTDKELKSLGLPLGSRKRVLEALKNELNNKEPPNEFLCPITADIMAEPVIAQDGFSYEKTAIDQWLNDHDKSPMTNETLASKILTPNRQLKKLIDDFRDGLLIL